MPRRTDIRSILIIGSGPIVIGQGCEFDYSGVQACRALREEGYRIVLINSNPATIMTDPEFADATYIEPITPEAVEKILEREKANGTPVDALLPTLGGQTGLNTGMTCWDKGILQKYGVQMIGANRDAIHRGEDRQVFKELMLSIGLKVPRSGVVHTMSDAMQVLADIGLPLIIRPAFTLGGTGGGIAYNNEEFEEIVQRGLDASPVTEVLIEQSVIGWKEYEMEVMRDKNDNVVIICSIENLDAMGIHTGDSITVAPIQTLTDKEYQRMRDASIAVIRAVGVETGGSNIQFGINPDNGDMVVIEMNPRVSRSSALASKATGYPIAKLAAKLAVGYTLDELPNYITSRLKPVNPKSEIRNPKSGSTKDAYESWTSACFEPTIDYCVIKIPRWTFEKFPDADETLTTQMKSVGEGMAIGRTFKEALQKGIRSMEVKRFGFGLDKYDKWLNAEKSPRRGAGVSPASLASADAERGRDARATAGGRAQTLAPQREPSNRQNGDAVGDRRAAAADASDKTTQGESLDHEWPIPPDKLRRKLAVPSQGRLYYLRYAMKMGWTIDQIFELTKIDRWFLGQMKELIDFEAKLRHTLKEIREEFYSLTRWLPGGKERFFRETSEVLSQAKSWGYSDVQLATLSGLKPESVRRIRDERGVKPVYKLVDTCAAEFEASTPYYYSTYETPFTVNGKPVHEDEIRLTDRPKVLIIGGGPNRIGQGIEFDYCCVQAAFALRDLGIESVMINSNPETVSTDYDTSDLLFFEPLTHEDILNICERLNGGPFAVREVRDFTDYSSAGISPSVATKAEFQNTVRRGLTEQASVSTAILGSRIASGGMATSYFVEYFVLTATGEVKLFTIDSRDSSSGKLLAPVKPIVADELVTGGWLSTTALASAREHVSQAASKNLVKGVIVQFGGQTPLNLARGLQEAGVPIIGTSVDSIDAAGDREQFRDLLQRLGLKQPENGIARNINEARDIARRIGYPVLVRPSFVLGGRAMEIVSDEAQLNFYMTYAVEASGDSPILIDKFLDAATEVDVDCLADFPPVAATPASPRAESAPREATQASQLQGGDEGQAIIIGVMEHIEEAGIHSGDSACALPPYSLPTEIVARLQDQTRALAKALRVRGLMNVQYAIRDGEIFVIEVNPRASRTVPFVGKATGVPWARIAAKVMAGKTLAELGVTEQPDPAHTSVKESVFPFTKFPGVDVILGPEMRSTGEVMGIDRDFPMAFAKAQLAAGTLLPTKGTVFISVRDGDKDAIIPVARMLAESGFAIVATSGTLAALARHDIPATRISKLAEGRPNIKDYIKNGKVDLIVNTPTRKGPQTDEGKIRALAVVNKIPIVTTATGANAAARAIRALQAQDWGVQPLQQYFTNRP